MIMTIKQGGLVGSHPQAHTQRVSVEPCPTPSDALAQQPALPFIDVRYTCHFLDLADSTGETDDAEQPTSSTAFLPNRAVPIL